PSHGRARPRGAAARSPRSWTRDRSSETRQELQPAERERLPLPRGPSRVLEGQGEVQVIGAHGVDPAVDRRSEREHPQQGPVPGDRTQRVTEPEPSEGTRGWRRDLLQPDHRNDGTQGQEMLPTGLLDKDPGRPDVGAGACDGRPAPEGDTEG